MRLSCVKCSEIFLGTNENDECAGYITATHTRGAEDALAVADCLFEFTVGDSIDGDATPL